MAPVLLHLILNFIRSMKKVYLFLAIIGLSSPVFAQSFGLQIVDKFGNDVTNGTYAIPSVDASQGGYTDLKFKLKNTGSSDLNLRVRRENVQQPSGYNNTICIDGFCYPATQDAPQGGVIIAPGGTDSTFYGTFNNPNGTTGDLCVTYTVYNAADESQFATVRAYYGACLTASVVENSLETINLTAYPNPASGSVLVKYNIATDAQLIITDITGKMLKNIRLNGGSQSTQVDISDLRAGVYVYSVQSGSKRIVSKKLVVR